MGALSNATRKSASLSGNPLTRGSVKRASDMPARWEVFRASVAGRHPPSA